MRVPARDADVAIVGAGPVGSTMAMLLAQLGWTSVVLEKDSFPRDKPCGEGLLPAGAEVLKDAGIDLAQEGFPRVRGVRYRLSSGESVLGRFRSGEGFGVRRLQFDQLLAERAAATHGITLHTSCRVQSVRATGEAIALQTSQGELRARYLVAADGLRSGISRTLGWRSANAGNGRYALVGHLQWSGAGLSEIQVTLLDGLEVYIAPSGRDEVLAVVMGPRSRFRQLGRTGGDIYAAAVTEADPELSGSPTHRLHGAGPFQLAATRVAGGRMFLLGDAAGFTDPLTGDGLTAGLLGARFLSSSLVGSTENAPAAYAAWHRKQFRRRTMIASLALRLTGSVGVARRAMRGIERRPAALETLLEINQGRAGFGTLRARDWAALAGL